MISIEELERRLAKPRPGRAILFTGAGFSYGAINRGNDPIPLARKFAAQLAAEIHESPDISLTVISELYNEAKSDDRALLEVLKNEFSAKNIAERRSDFYTYKVDNSFAQFLLESRRDVDIWSDFYDVFVEASTLAQQQTKMQRTGFYPYKVVSLFESFLSVRARSFTKKQKQDALELCLAWIRRIDELPRNTARNHLVRQARAAANNSYELLTEMLG